MQRSIRSRRLNLVTLGLAVAMVLLVPVNAWLRVQPDLVGVPGMIWSKLLVVAVFAPVFAALWLLRPPRHRG